MSLSDEELKIKFPESHYIGLREEQNGAVTAFATPEGTDSGAKKRKSTVYNWYKSGLRSYDYAKKENVFKDTPEPAAYENKAMAGFTIERRLNRGGSWNGGQDKWKIDDPRGFVLEISGNNLQKIIELTTIVEGEIQGECIWARLGADNILVPVESELYKQAVVNTTRAGKSIPLKHLELGRYCVMQNGFEGYFQGKYYIVTSDYGSGHAQRYITSEKERYIFWEPKTNKLHHIATPKIAEMPERNYEFMNEEELNELANQGEWYERGITGNPDTGRVLTSIKGPVGFRLEPYSRTREELKDSVHQYMLVKRNDNDTMMLVHENAAYGTSLVDKSLMYIKEAQRGHHYGTNNMRNVTIDVRNYPELLKNERFVVNFVVKTGYGEHILPF